jgi:hypothetical protein
MIRYRIRVVNDHGLDDENFIVNDQDHAEIIGKLLTFLYKHQPCYYVKVTYVDEDGDDFETMNIG